MVKSAPTRSTPLIWPLLAVLILWAGIALLAWLLWNGKQVSLRDPRRNLVALIERVVTA